MAYSRPPFTSHFTIATGAAQRVTPALHVVDGTAGRAVDDRLALGEFAAAKGAARAGGAGVEYHRSRGVRGQEVDLPAGADLVPLREDHRGKGRMAVDRHPGPGQQQTGLPAGRQQARDSIERVFTGGGQHHGFHFTIGKQAEENHRVLSIMGRAGTGEVTIPHHPADLTQDSAPTA